MKAMLKRSKKILSLLLCSVMLGCTAFAAEPSPRAIYKTYTSKINHYSIQGYNFDIYTDAHYTTSGSILGNAAVWVEADANVPAGAMSVRAYLVRYDGYLIRDTKVKTNTSSTSFLWAQTDDTSLVYGEEIAFGGEVKLTLPGGSAAPDVYSVRYMNGSCTSGAPIQPGQPLSVNSQGLSYGTVLDRDSTGALPDLLGAVGVDGNDGYVLRTDFSPNFYNLQGLERIQAKQAENNRIPLYDSELNQIGWYATGTLERTEGPDEITQKHIQELSARDLPAAGDESCPAFLDLYPEYAEAYSAGLVDGDYPTNDKGETFGTIMNMWVTGYDPDWVAYIGDHGTPAYMRFLDFSNPRNNTVDLYDMDGNVVDQFTFRGTSSVR